METLSDITPSTAGRNASVSVAALDLAELRKHLCPLAYTQWGARQVHDIETRLLKLQKGNRCTVEIAIQTGSHWHYLIGKVYAKDRADVFEAMKKIWHSGLNRESAFSIPCPVAYLSSLRLLLQEKVEGALAKRVFLDGSTSRCVEAAERCALWLARFQAAAPPQGKIMDVQRILRHGERRVRFLVEASMPFASKARKLFEGLAASPPTLDTMCAGHGDYKPDHQFLLPEGDTVTFDWDCYDIADPCRDAALFLIYLKRLALVGRDAVRKLERACQVFLKTYIAASQPGIEARLRFHKAALYLQEAKRDVGEQHSGWLERAEIMLEQGLRELQA
jgi:hypothetical protein